MRIFKVLFLLTIAQNLIYSQNHISFSTNWGNYDTLKLCSDEPIRFNAFVVNSQGDTLNGYTVSWDFDNGDKDSLPDLYSYEYQYLTGGFYRLFIRAIKQNDTLYYIKPIKVGLKPFFTGTKADIPSQQTGICDGDEVRLLPNITPRIWKERRQTSHKEIYPIYLDHTFTYQTTILRKNFAQNQKVTSITDIDSIGIKLEHSASATVRISLQCENGQQLLLKDFGGNNNRFGEPITVVGNLEPGVGYWYWFKNSSTNGTINSFPSTNQTIPAGVYQSQNNFTSLVGCPLNGSWSIIVQDNANDNHNGYIFEWAIYFNKNIETDTVKFQNIYNLQTSVWSGDGINYTDNGIGYANPRGKGAHRFDFLIKDDFGCWHDTSIIVRVEKPQINLEKNTMYCGDSTRFEDVTTWSKQWRWNFGDNSDIFTEKSGYKKYLDTGTYKIILTAISQSGCKDYDTAKIVITAKPIDIVAYNIFTPNGDGKNDIFSFFNTPEEKITADNIDKISGAIYDRNGVVVCRWETVEELKKGWDGTYFNNGIRSLPAGQYYYVLKIKGKNGISYKPFFGTVYLYK